MTNLLTKDAAAYVPPEPATQGTPGTPAYWVTESATVCGIFSSGVTYGWTEPTDGSDPAYIPLATGASPGLITYRCVTTTRRRYVPAVPATPGTPGGSLAQALAGTYNLGWNGGARSLSTLKGDGYATFKVSSITGGVVAGFNGADNDTHPNEIEHGLILTGGTVRVIQSGAIVASTGTYATNDTFKVRRVGSTITYYKGATLLYTSLVSSSGEVFLDVCLYAARDAITDPTVVDEAASPTNESGGATMTLPALAALGGSFGGVSGVHGTGEPELPMLTVIAYAGAVVPSIAYGGAALPALTLGAHGLVGQVGGATLTLPELDVFGGAGAGVHGLGAVTLPAMTIYSDNYEGNTQATLGGITDTAAAMDGMRLAIGLMSTSVTVAPTLVAVLYAEASALSSITVSATELASALRYASMSSSITVGAALARVSTGDVTGRDDGFQVWAVDLDSETYPSSMYEHYDFNSFADLDGVCYGAKADGVFLLEGDRDYGDVRIRASVDFGRHSMGTNLKKRVPYVYVGVATSGQIVLRVTVDGGASYNYYALNPKDEQQVVRFDLGQGLKGSYWKFELFNVGGGDVDLDTIEFTPVIVPRRIL
jgi:hypothetical protein